ncbi:MAG: META domain-containing protein [Cyanobacteria bacterium P01_A01_bin.116]
MVETVSAVEPRQAEWRTMTVLSERVLRESVLSARALSARVLRKRVLGLALSAIALGTLSVACMPIDDVAALPDTEDVEMPAEEAPAAEEVSLDGTIWQLISYDQQPVLAETEVTAEFADGQVSGSGGCNGYFAEATLSGNQLTVGPISSTKIACAVTLAQESDYFNLLGQAQSVAIADNVLTITTTGGDLIFQAQSSE